MIGVRMKDIQFPVSYAMLYRSTIHPTKPSKRTPIHFVNFNIFFYVKYSTTACFTQHENVWRTRLNNEFIYFRKYIQTFDIVLSQTRTMLNNLKFFGKYIRLSLLPVIFPRYILYADVVTPLSRNLPGAFMALLWSSAWRRLIKPISRVLCKLSVL